MATKLYVTVAGDARVMDTTKSTAKATGRDFRARGIDAEVLEFTLKPGVPKKDVFAALFNRKLETITDASESVAKYAGVKRPKAAAA